MPDTLTKLDWLADQRRYMHIQATAKDSVVFVGSAAARELDGDGQVLVRRVLRALLSASTDLAPAKVAPRAHHTAYSLIRRSVHFALLRYIAETATGSDGPVLSDPAAQALAMLEGQDILIAAPTNRLAYLALLLGGVSWRADLEGAQ